MRDRPQPTNSHPDGDSSALKTADVDRPPLWQLMYKNAKPCEADATTVAAVLRG